MSHCLQNPRPYRATATVWVCTACGNRKRPCVHIGKKPRMCIKDPVGLYEWHQGNNEVESSAVYEGVER